MNLGVTYLMRKKVDGKELLESIPDSLDCNLFKISDTENGLFVSGGLINFSLDCTYINHWAVAVWFEAHFMERMLVGKDLLAAFET